MLQIKSENLSKKIPLRADAHGTIRVGDMRVTLSAVLACFDYGATPEAIVDSFNTLQLADVYCVIGDYLCHKDEVRAHLKQERQEGAVLRTAMEAALPPSTLRERLVKRKHASRAGPEECSHSVRMKTATS